MKCAEIWGGVRNQDADVCSAGITASLYSAACGGGKGGDVYYFSVCESDQLTRIAVADVVGHGEAVSEMGERLYSELEWHMSDTNGDDILLKLNRFACDRGFGAITTAVVAGYYTADSHAYFSSAGHQAALVRRAAHGRWEAAHVDGSNERLSNLPLGVDRETVYTQLRTPLSRGDRLFLYTDGLTEAPNADGEQFGDTRLMAILERMGGASLETIKRSTLEAVSAHVGGPYAYDDVTVLAIEVTDRSR